MAGITPLPFIQITRLDDDDDDRRPHVATEKDKIDQNNDPTWSLREMRPLAWASLPNPSVCLAAVPRCLLVDAWVGRHASNQVLMSLNRGRCLRGVAPDEEESTMDVSKMIVIGR